MDEVLGTFSPQPTVVAYGNRRTHGALHELLSPSVAG